MKRLTVRLELTPEGRALVERLAYLWGFKGFNAQLVLESLLHPAKLETVLREAAATAEKVRAEQHAQIRDLFERAGVDDGEAGR